ncbi:18018_t:CDS:10, partial [Acaulospora morrowiae]
HSQPQFFCGFLDYSGILSNQSADYQLRTKHLIMRQHRSHYNNYQAQQQQQYYANQYQNQDSHSVILVTAGYDHTIRFWEALSGICSRTIQHPDSQVNRLCISPDKRYLAAAGNQHIRLYDINSPNSNPITSFDGHTGNVTAVGFHCEGKWMVTGSEDGTLKIWDTRHVILKRYESIAPSIQRNYDHKAPVNDVAIYPNQGELISCDQKGSIKIWDLSENSCTHELVPEEDVPLRSVTIAFDGSMLVAANNKGNCYVWKMSNTRDYTDPQTITKFSAHDRYITRCLLSPDAKNLATCSADSTVKIWSTSNNEFKLDKELTGHQRWVWDCAFSADSAYLVTASSDHSARLWELQQGETIRQYNGHHKAAVCVALNDLSIGN